MPWWGWVVVGAVLLGSELFVTADFYLVFLGIAALAVGLAALAGWPEVAWQQWALFALLAGGALALFRGRIYRRIAPGARVGELVVGEIAVVGERIEPGGVGRAELRGTTWTARNTSAAPLEPGSRARVEHVDGLVLCLRAEGA
jgi:hypothetical protein